jgi:hypothetical protein
MNAVTPDVRGEQASIRAERRVCDVGLLLEENAGTDRMRSGRGGDVPGAGPDAVVLECSLMLVL